MNIVCRDVTYAVEITGNGEPLVLLHGFTGNRDTWKFLIPFLHERYTMIMVDIIGHGMSAAPADFHRYEMEHVAEDIKYILESCISRKPISLDTPWAEGLHWVLPVCILSLSIH